MNHNHVMPQGKIEILHEWRDCPAGHDTHRQHFCLEANAKGLLVLTETTLNGNHAGRKLPIEIYEISPNELIKLIRKHGAKLRIH
jgi:hypothetical protein